MKDIKDITADEAKELVQIAMYHPDFTTYEDVKDDVDIDEIGYSDNLLKINHTCCCFIGALMVSKDGHMWFVDEDGENPQPVYNLGKPWGYLKSQGYDVTTNYLNN